MCKIKPEHAVPALFRSFLLTEQRNERQTGEKVAELIGKPLSISFVGPLKKPKGLDVALAS
ncbi:hypothetical protein HXA31_14775 [Salipaludibacillus agaradhaerens]|uniref:Uncharacterized protein n=1 Tax=Salipaludibacillus agaradhaerens TaxID=76935 RepID=A0A9Q4B5C0_SALAG|nr:hypothetical protein [Salipaludibacillus agaradhaerens]MCR6098624.1 hypothetical protein [Salipaludibacillus agaradhaerens]MCR6115631.1 hypothetical protein [Salipaludibacillus agaradhaerens]